MYNVNNTSHRALGEGFSRITYPNPNMYGCSALLLRGTKSAKFIIHMPQFDAYSVRPQSSLLVSEATIARRRLLLTSSWWPRVRLVTPRAGNMWPIPPIRPICHGPAKQTSDRNIIDIMSVVLTACNSDPCSYDQRYQAQQCPAQICANQLL